jgi:hypothetical protein
MIPLIAAVVTATLLSLPDGHYTFHWTFDGADLPSSAGNIRGIVLEGDWKDSATYFGLDGALLGENGAMPAHATCFRNIANGINCTIFAIDGQRMFIARDAGYFYLCNRDGVVCWTTDKFLVR